MIAYLITAGLAAWAFEHMAYIIQYGSIFERQREWVRRSGSEWMHELIHCQLCTTTQLCLWLWALPMVWWGTPLALPLPLEFMVVWFSQAALSLLAYDIARFVGRFTDALIWRARKDV